MRNEDVPPNGSRTRPSFKIRFLIIVCMVFVVILLESKVKFFSPIAIKRMLEFKELVKQHVYAAFNESLKSNLTIVSVKIEIGMNDSRTNATDPSQVTKKPANLAFHWDDDLHLYLLNGKPVIWTFWDKLPIPAHIRLSMATVKCHNPDVHFEIVHEHQLSELFGYVHPAIKYLAGAHKGDYFRGTVLNLYGGIWIDADTVAFGSVRPKFEKLRTYDLLGYDWSPYGAMFSIAVIGPIRARTEFTQTWVKKLHAKLDEKLPLLKERAHNLSVPYSINWGEILGEITNEIIPQYVNNGTLRYLKQSGTQTIGQLAYWNILSYQNESRVIKHTEFIFYFNTPIDSNEMRALTPRKLLTMNFHLSSIFKASLARCRNGQKLGPNDTITINTEENNEPELINWIENYLVENDLG